MTAVCPFCKRQVTVFAQTRQGATIPPTFRTHGPSTTGGFFCEGSGKAVAK